MKFRYVDIVNAMGWEPTALTVNCIQCSRARLVRLSCIPAGKVYSSSNQIDHRPTLLDMTLIWSVGPLSANTRVVVNQLSNVVRRC